MIFEKYLIPDYVFGTFREVTPEFLRSIGVEYIFSDIDNTLATYEDPLPPIDVVNWCKSMDEAGVKLAFVSNNDEERVRPFSEAVGVPYYPKAGKPLQKKLRQAVADLGADIGKSMLLGDQLLTDCAAGKLAGMTVVIVPPIKDKKSAFFRLKRWLEVPYMKKYYKAKGEIK